MREYLKSFEILSEKDIDQLIKIGVERSLKKYEYLIREGEQCREVAFLVRGIFRSFFTSEEGNEITYCINFPPQFTTAYSAYISGKESEESIQAITDVEVWMFPRKELLQLAETNPRWMKFHRVLAEQQYCARKKNFFSSKTRYNTTLL
jgi:CRP-like cAMP-binding protein